MNGTMLLVHAQIGRRNINMAQVRHAVGSTVAVVGKVISDARTAHRDNHSKTEGQRTAAAGAANSKNAPAFPPAKQKFLGVF